MKVKLLHFIFATGLIVILSCSRMPYDTEIMQEQLIDITQYDTKADFSSYKTFAIVDSVSYIKDGDSTRVLDQNAIDILQRIVDNMEKIGYEKVALAQNPDLGIAVSVITITNVTYYYPGWYWGYPGYYDPYYWGYPGSAYYYPYYPTYVTSYSSGTLIIDMLDLKNAEQNDNKLFIIWNAYIRGLLGMGNTMSTVLENIDQCFNQTKPFQTGN